ncbi:helix-turn-helix domain-containing protein [Porticoccus sp. GXU_MW_L64]
MKADLKHRIAKFISEKRNGMPYREFGRLYGINKDMASRLEKEEENITIDSLEHLCKAFRCDIADLFPK